MSINIMIFYGNSLTPTNMHKAIRNLMEDLPHQKQALPLTSILVGADLQELVTLSSAA
jgi:hypothetical protein